MSFSVNSPSKNVNLLFFSSEKVTQEYQDSSGNPLDKIDEKTNHDDIPDLGYYFNPWAGIDNDCNYIDDKCKQET